MNVTIRPYEPADLYSVMTVCNSVTTEGDAFLEETTSPLKKCDTFSISSAASSVQRSAMKLRAFIFSENSVPAKYPTLPKSPMR